MENKIATETFRNGYNCAQSIIAAFAPGRGLSRELSLQLATGLGGGINGQGGTCGAVVGSLIVLGLHYGTEYSSDTEGREKFKLIANKFSEDFLKQHNSLKCGELLSAEAGDPDKVSEMKANGEFHEFCTCVVKDAALLLEEILQNEN